MSTLTAKQLARKKCVPCEGGVPKLSVADARKQLQELPGWKLTHRGQRIRKNWLVKDFVAGLTFLEKVGQLAEEVWHHPDLHIEGYRKVWIEISTHAIGGLSENDFILAAKIDRSLPAAS